MSGPLAHLRVVDVTASLAGAYAARLLGELGADVDRVSRMRNLYVRIKGREMTEWDPMLHRSLNANKAHRSNTDADSLTPESLLAILDGQDILIEDIGLLDGDAPFLDWDVLHTRYPHLTVVSLTPYGNDGPLANLPPSDLATWSLSGMAWTTPGPPDTTYDLPSEPPLMPTGASVPSLMAGAVSVVGTLATLYADSGSSNGASPGVTGTRIELTELEAITALNYHPVTQREYLEYVLDRGPNILARQPNCYIECKDGYIVIVAMSARHWEQFAEVMGSPEWAYTEDYDDGTKRAMNWDAVSVLMTNWTMEKTGEEITTELQARNIPAFWATSIEEVMTHEHVKERRYIRNITTQDGQQIPYTGVPFILTGYPRNEEGKPEADDSVPVVPSTNGASTSHAGSTPSLPLKGIRVVDFGQYIAIPYCAKWLAALGADVIQVESRENPADFRNSPPFAAQIPGMNRAGAYNTLSMGKRAIPINLRTEEGRDVARRLCASADIVLENFSTGLMERWGLGYGDIAPLNPRVIYTSVAAFGRSGPLKDYSGLHSIINAFCGLADVTGYTDGHRRLLGSYFPDVVSATYATMATLTALHDRKRTGMGHHVDVAMTEALMTLITEPMVARAVGSYTLSRDGSHHPLHAPHNIFPAAGDDQWIAVTARTDTEWAGLCNIIDGLANDTRFATPESRKQNEAALDEIIAAWTASRDKYEMAEQLAAAGVSAAPILDPLEVVEHPHQQARGFFATIDHPEAGPRRTAKVPWKVNGEHAGELRRAPMLNEHTDAILTEILGINQEETNELVAADALR
ncbi:MAG: CoA transferase [Chloroflexi bacterium]|nr:CoA transferase [Chloroflexota bacterium]